MRIIAIQTLRNYIRTYPNAGQSLLSWNQEIESANWKTPNELKEHYRSASVISQKRVVFNIHGNRYRLIVDVEFKLKLVFIVWFGPHEDYDKIDARKISYDRAYQK